MSDAVVLWSIEQMESWIRCPETMPPADALAAWDRDFQAAVKNAEHGPGWATLVSRAHALGVQVTGRAAELGIQRDELRIELNTQERGGRALKGYEALTR